MTILLLFLFLVTALQTQSSSAERVGIIKVECILVNYRRERVFVEILSGFLRYDRLLACRLGGDATTG